MNENFTLSAFAEPITALADTPQCSAAELKRRLEAPAEELRQAHNALAACVQGITDATYPETVSESMLTSELSGKINGKAEQSDMTAVQSEVAQKCEVVLGTYTGDGTAAQEIKLGFQPRALFTANSQGRDGMGNYYYGGLVFPELPSKCAEITETGFTVNNSESGNSRGNIYKYIALK